MSNRVRRRSLIDGDGSNKTSDEKYRFDFSDEDRFNLGDEDAVSNFSSQAFDIPPMLKFKDLKQAIFSWVNKLSPHSPHVLWFSEEGCKCEFLLVRGGGWQKGRFRFRLEFIPDNPEAFLPESAPKEEKPQSLLDDLDDLRSQLNPE
ncbi:MAG: KGK domain-containing protein [Nostoc sp.]|uniref:KGK domain-containing protein n=1 Tax=Nostoc sp. TaxID=1180 RepID=UPI002FF67F20